MKKYLTIIFLPEVFFTALKVSLVMGSVLALINHYPAISSHSLSAQNIMQIGLTYLVPYGVSSYSSAKVILNKKN